MRRNLHMPELLDNPASAQPKSSHIFDFDLGAWSILAVAFLLRLWTAYGTFLNPDEALH